jgi:hypothetical protein
MASTKIIHVLKSDKFEDIFDLFKNSDAEEVIFIFPRGSKFTKQSWYFENIKSEADNSGKKVSIMSEDPIIAGFASASGLDLISMPERKKHKATLAIPRIDTAEREPYEEKEPEPELIEPESSAAVASYVLDTKESVLGGDFGNIHAEADHGPSFEKPVSDENEPEVVLAAKRMMKDIFTSEADRPVEIKEESESPVEVEVRNNVSSQKIRGDITEVWSQKDSQDDQLLPSTVSRKGISKKILAFGFIFLLAILFVLYSALGHAQITIHPQTQKLNFKLKVSVSTTATQTSPEFSLIPGQRFTVQKEEAGSYPSSGQGNVVQKAGGKITIYNKTTTSQRLVATTRFETTAGLIFRIPQTINVPAAVKSGSALQEGSIDSAVYADRPGVEYNIGPTKFTIPGFSGTPKADSFYAISSSSMTGGMVGSSKVVTEEDFTKAQQELTAKLKDEITNSLKNQANDLKILDSAVVKIEDPVVNAKVGEAADNLQMTIKGSADTIAFREDDITDLIKNYLSKNGDLELLPVDPSITYQNPVLNADKSMLTFDVQVSAQAASKVDPDKILKDISGMNEDEVRTYFKNVKEVQSARIVLSPFWVKSIPTNPAKIKIDVSNN